MIEIQKINKIYSNGYHAVKDISLEIKTGDIFGVIGLSGAGKSSLIRLLNRLEEPTSGKIIIDGVDITSLSKKDLLERRKKIGMIFQHFNLMKSRTISKNISYPLKGSNLSKKEIDLRVEELLELVNLKEKKENYPSQLSGGQKQRVGIARALANKPDIILCDEATSALDPETTISILKLLKKVNQELGVTIILITHQMEVIKEICDRVIVMEKGKKLLEGTPKEVFSKIDTLKNIGLDVPCMTELSNLLKSEGLDIRDDILTVDEMVMELCQL